MKKIFTTIFFLLAAVCVFAAEFDPIFNVMVQRTLFIRSGISRKAAVYYPLDFLSNPTKVYPMLLWNHGSGETGTGYPGLPNLATGDGIPEEFAAGRLTNALFTIPGTSVQKEFIIICLQNQSNATPFTPSELDYAFKHDTYIAGRYDPMNVFIAGYSLGGIAASRHLAVQEAAFLANYRAMFYFSAPKQAGYAATGQPYDYSAAIAQKIPVWQFMGLSDLAGRITFTQETDDILNAANPGQCKTTWVVGGHTGWQQGMLSRSYREDGMNVFEWCLSKSTYAGGPTDPTDPETPPTGTGTGFEYKRKWFQRFKIKF